MLGAGHLLSTLRGFVWQTLAIDDDSAAVEACMCRMAVAHGQPQHLLGRLDQHTWSHAGALSGMLAALCCALVMLLMQPGLKEPVTICNHLQTTTAMRHHWSGGDNEIRRVQNCCRCVKWQARHHACYCTYFLPRYLCVSAW